MNSKKILIGLFFFGLVFQCLAQINVINISSGSLPPDAEGLIYALPQTMVRVDLVVNRIQKTKGPFSEFADQLLGLSQVILNNSVEYELESIRLTSYNEPDPLQYYFIQLPHKQKDRQAVELFLSSDGILSGAGISDTLRNIMDRGLKDLSVSNVSAPEITNPNMLERMDTVVKKISLDTSIIEQKFFRKTSTAKTTEQKAREAADFILKLDDSMFNLINGYHEVNYDKGTIEFMYNQMGSMKKDYLELFKGISNSSSESFSYYFVAVPENTSQTLCKFSPSRGIISKNSGNGEPIMLQVDVINNANEVKNKLASRNSAAELSHGIYYRIPVKSNVSVIIGGLTKIESKFSINQLGILSFIPASSLRHISLDNNTGAVKSVILQ